MKIAIATLLLYLSMPWMQVFGNNALYYFPPETELTAAKVYGEFDNVRVPITRIGNLILVEAKIGNQTGFFVLDTGAPYLVLNETYFRDLVVANQRTYTDVNGQSRSANVTYVPKLELRSLYYKNLRADLANLASIENSRGVKVLGLMGINLFLDLEMHINIKEQVLELQKVDKKGIPLLPTLICEKALQMPFSLKNRVILVEARLKSQTLKFCFDSAAEVTALSTGLSDEIYSSIVFEKQIDLIGSSGATNRVLYGRLNGLEIGVPINGCNAIITNLSELSKAYGTALDGMIGYDLLKQGIVILNFKTETFTFCPNT